MATAPLVAAWGRSFPRALPGPFAASPGPSGRPPVDFGNGRPIQVTVYLALGADLTADPSTWMFTNITRWVRHASGITADTGRTDQSVRVGPGSGSLTLDNTDGRFCRLNPTGPYYGLLTRNTPILVEVNAGNGGYQFLAQYVNEWPARADKSGTDFTIPIQTGGILRRLNRNGAPLKSALRRGLEAGNDFTGNHAPFAYWPMEDASGAEFFASAISGKAPITWYDNNAVAPGTADMTDLGGSGPLPVLTTGAFVSASVGMTTNAEWTVQFVGKIQFSGAATSELIRWETPGGTPWIWRLSIMNSSPVGIVLDGLDSDGTALPAFSLPIAFYDQQLVEGIDRWFMIVISARQSGGNILYSYVYSFGENTTAMGSGEATDAGTLKGVSSVKIGAAGGAGLPAALTGTSIGHLVVLNDDWGYFQLTDDELMGVRAETAVDRLERVCAEQGVPISFAPGVIPSVQMGRQTAASFIDILRECEEADGGVLYEKGFGLYYQPAAARYNRPVDFKLDFDRGDIAEAPEPTDDDQRLLNSVTVTRTGGEAVTVVDQDSIDAEGLYEDSATVNTFTATLAEQWANWHLHLGMADDPRWPRLALRFDNDPGKALIQAWEDLAPGARCQVANQPEQFTFDAPDLFIEGKSEYVDEFVWTAEVNASPAAPYWVFVLDDPVLGKLDTDGSVLSAGSSSAKAEGTALTKDYITVADFAAAPFGIGDQFQLYNEAGFLKETTVFTITSKPSGFGFTELHFTPNSQEYPTGVYPVGGDTARHVSETSFLVAVASGYLWTTDAADFPFDILVGGERMTVTAISGASSPQTFTVTRSVNGVQKSHLANSVVKGDFAVLAK